MATPGKLGGSGDVLLSRDRIELITLFLITTHTRVVHINGCMAPGLNH